MRSSLRKAFSLRGDPTEAIDNIIASLAPATLKQYATALKTWWQFCQTHNENYYFPDTTNVLRLLNQEFKKGASYGSLNTLRSAISLISKEKIGEDPLISRFLRGSFKLKPSNPKYDYTWDVNIVLKNLPLPLEDLSLQALSEKNYYIISSLHSPKRSNIRKHKNQKHH